MNGEKKEWAVERLKEKSRETGRLPKKEDFDPVTLSRIKAFLGPWPRALEGAGLKERKTAARGGKNRGSALKPGHSSRQIRQKYKRCG